MNSSNNLTPEKKLGNFVRFLPEVAQLIGVAETLMLMNLHYWSSDGRCNHPDKWVYKSAEEWAEETALTKKQQQRARRNLVKMGVVNEHYHRQIHKLYFRINTVMFAELLAISEQKADKRKQEKKRRRSPTFRMDEDADESAGEAIQPQDGSDVLLADGPYDERIVGNLPTGNRHAPKRPFDIAESTAESFAEKPISKPLTGGKRLSEFSSEEPPLPPGDLPPLRSTRQGSGCAEPGAEDSAQKPSAIDAGGAPAPRQRDWCGRVAASVPAEAVTLFEGLFPKYPGALTKLPAVARRFLKLWERGAVSLPDLRLLRRFWASGAQWDTKWRKDNPFEFLSGKECVRPAIEASRTEWQEGIHEARQHLDLWADADENSGIGIMLRGDLETAETQLLAWAQAPTREPIVDFIRSNRALNVAAICFWFIDARWDEYRVVVQAQLADEIRAGIRKWESWKAYVAKKGIRTTHMWAVPPAELHEILAVERARLEAIVEAAVGK